MAVSERPRRTAITVCPCLVAGPRVGQAVYRLVPLPRRSATRPGVWTKSCRLRDLGSTRRVWLSQRGLVAGPHERYEQRVYNHPPAHPLSPHPIPPSRPSSRFVFCLSRLQIRRVYAQESFPLWVESSALDFTELGRYLAERKWRKKTEKHHTLLAPPHTLPSPHLSSPPLQTSPPSLHPHPPLAPSTYCHHCNRCHHRPQPSPWPSLQSLPSSTPAPAQLTPAQPAHCRPLPAPGGGLAGGRRGG